MTDQEIRTAIERRDKLPRLVVISLDAELRSAYDKARSKAASLRYLARVPREVRLERQRKIVHAYYLRHRDKVLADQQARRDALKKPQRVMTAGELEERRLRKLAAQRAWAARNRDRTKAATRRHLDKVGGAHKTTWAIRNRDKIRESKRLQALKHYAKNRAACNARAINSHHKRRAAGGPGVSRLEWREILAAHGGLCAYCLVAPGKTMDHVLPLSRGGVHAPHNVVPACKRCNCSKHNKLLSEWTSRPYQPVAA